MEMQGKKNDDFFIYMLLAGVFVVVLNSFYVYFFRQNYPFIVETKCDPQTQTCFYRDCEGNPDLCPPNNLSYYNEYTINARDFKSCANEDCTEACTNGTIECEKTECSEGDIADGICVLPQIDDTIIPETLNQ